MSQHDETQRPSDTDETVLEPNVAPGGTPVPVAEPTPGQPDPDGPTIGTGTSIALGCVAGTILLIVIGLLYILLLAIF